MARLVSFGGVVQRSACNAPDQGPSRKRGSNSKTTVRQLS